ncbi:MAG: Crp/Fnr family transcriptional regulator [Burkholderiaceae bacterium]
MNTNVQLIRPAVPQGMGQGKRAENWSSDLSELLSREPRDGVPQFFHRTLKAGQRLVHGGQEFESLYLVNAGWFKTVFVDESGEEQVMGFSARGDLLGADGIGSAQYLNEVIALGVADVVVIPFAQRGDLSRLKPGLEAALLQIISRQMVNSQLATLAISTLPAPSRLARFLLSHGERMAMIGFNEQDFELAMSRQDIASYLGMTIETVSRGLTRFAKQGLIKVTQRRIEVLNHAATQALAYPAGVLPRSEKSGHMVDPVAQLSRAAAVLVQQ